MRKRKTHAQFLEDLKRVRRDDIYVEEGEYVNARTPLLFNKRSCDHPPWPATPNRILCGSGCPDCGGKKKKTHEQFLEELKQTHGDDVYVEEGEYDGNKKHLLFNKRSCDHPPWPATPNSILRGNCCPDCGGSKKKTHEQFLEELRNVHGYDIYVEEGEYVNSNKHLLFNKRSCDHPPWPAKPHNILHGRSCPDCGGKKKKTHEQFLEELKQAHSDDIYVEEGEYVNARTPLLFNKRSCVHPPWPATPDSILRGSGCPICNESKGEIAVAEWLTENNHTFQREVQLPYCEYKRGLYFDFALTDKKVLIEFDGEYHYSESTHRDPKRFSLQQKRDKIKDEYCREHNYHLIRIPYWDMDRIDEILMQELS